MQQVPRGDPADDPRPWERSGAVRRDCLPHRGRLLELLGAAALPFCVLACCVGFTGFVGIPLAVAVCRMAGRDLREMEVGRLDPAGRRSTVHAWRIGAIGAVTASAFLVLWAANWLRIALVRHL